MTKVRIGERWVVDGEPTYIVAEAGSNHNGSFEQALKLIDAAADARGAAREVQQVQDAKLLRASRRGLRWSDAPPPAGADAVKFQHFKAAKLYPRSAGASDYLNTPRSIY